MPFTMVNGKVVPFVIKDEYTVFLDKSENFLKKTNDQTTVNLKTITAQLQVYKYKSL